MFWESLKVFFPQVGSVEIQRQSWFKRNKQGNVVGSICQYPLVLAYAATCHKAQGLTLAAAVVHCSNEFVSGLTYVALSRVKDQGHLQVLNFKRHFLQPPNPRVSNECSTDLGHLRDDLQCCRNKILPAHFFTVQDRYVLEETEGEEMVFPDDVGDAPVASYFDGSDESEVDTIKLFDELAKNDSELSRPPPTLEISAILNSMKVEKPVTDFASDKNSCLQTLEDRLEDKTTAFVNLVWKQVYELFAEYIIENPDKEVIFNISRAGFTSCTGKLHRFLNSELLATYTKGLYNCLEITRPQRTIVVALVTKLYDKFLGNIVKVVARAEETESQEPVRVVVEEMSASGKAKVRHVGGWAIRKILKKERKYARLNMNT